VKVSNLKITNVKTILTAPGGIDLAVVKVETNEPGLYGWDVQHLPNVSSR
jgi:mannonate dehydratase